MFNSPILTIAQIIGVMVPLLGTIVLLRKEHSKVSVNLMLANVACLMMNGGYTLVLRSQSYGEAMLAFLSQHLGSVFFYLFFTRFISSYLFPKRSTNFLFAWLGIESVSLFLLWKDNWGKLVFSDIQYQKDSAGNFGYLVMEPGIVLNLRHGMICITLIIGLGYTMYRMFKTTSIKERRNLARLTGAEAVILGALILTLMFKPVYDIVPVASSVAVLAIILSVITGEFFSVTDKGRDWVFEHIEDVFLIVDDTYGYLDSNAYAREVFPELQKKRKTEQISKELVSLFERDEERVLLADRYYEKNVTAIRQDEEIAGYSLLLLDITNQQRLIEELKIAKEKAEEANRAKSDFISNMSHEIRTPMNAIVGMTEILLRGNLEEQQKGYLRNIKSSGNALLMIINDILDVSKMEAGMMKIVQEEYEPMSMLSDLSMIFLNRIGEKNIELLFDIDETLPQVLYGDSLRIRQIIINLMNNAIKFTEEGYVKLVFKVNKKTEEELELTILVQDTGQGIKPEELKHLFQSFVQVDTKRNRDKEGTGLGLALCKKLTNLMGGTIGVNSVYGEGSEFFVTFPQGIRGKQLAAEWNKPEEQTCYISSLLQNSYLTDSLKELAKRYQLDYIEYEAAKETRKNLSYLFTDDLDSVQDMADRVWLEAMQTEICLLQNPMKESVWDKTVVLVNKPLFSLNFCQILNHQVQSGFVESEEYLNFKAPKARILIVDDNEMNLTVAKGLLAPLEMQMDTADSGKRALQMLETQSYHIVFMDHMMPEMDGIEATQQIRQREDTYFKTLPVIALTANAVAGAKEMFLQAGFNDFVAKPIEMKEICMKIKHWLPKELIQKQTVTEPWEEKQPESSELEIAGLDTAMGIKYSGGKALYLKLLGDFYKLIERKAVKIEKCLADGLLRDYTIEVHALKNTARMIGAAELSELCYQLECYGNAEQREEVEKLTPQMLALYRSYLPILASYGEDAGKEKRKMTKESFFELLGNIRQAVENFDFDTVDFLMKQFEEYQAPDEYQENLKELKALVADVAMEEILTLTGQILDEIQEIEFE